MYPQNLKSSIFPKKLFIPSCYAHALHSEMDPSMSLGMFAPESSLSNWPINAHNHQQIEIWTQITIYFDPFECISINIRWATWSYLIKLLKFNSSQLLFKMKKSEHSFEIIQQTISAIRSFGQRLRLTCSSFFSLGDVIFLIC